MRHEGDLYYSNKMIIKIFLYSLVLTIAHETQLLLLRPDGAISTLTAAATLRAQGQPEVKVKVCAQFVALEVIMPMLA